MIVTLTANPSVDRTLEVAGLRPGTVIRARASRVDAGGKGVNVARALAAHGRKVKAVLPSGGGEGAQLEALLASAGLDVRTVRIAGPIRANVTVVEADGTTTKLNEPGPRLSPDELDALAAALCDAAASADWVVLSGSLSPGAPVHWYARIIERLRGTGPLIAIDSSGRRWPARSARGPTWSSRTGRNSPSWPAAPSTPSRTSSAPRGLSSAAACTPSSPASGRPVPCSSAGTPPGTPPRRRSSRAAPSSRRRAPGRIPGRRRRPGRRRLRRT